jgi:hypothetical protein
MELTVLNILWELGGVVGSRNIRTGVVVFCGNLYLNCFGAFARV